MQGLTNFKFSDILFSFSLPPPFLHLIITAAVSLLNSPSLSISQETVAVIKIILGKLCLVLLDVFLWDLPCSVWKALWNHYFTEYARRELATLYNELSLLVDLYSDNALTGITVRTKRCPYVAMWCELHSAMLDTIVRIQGSSYPVRNYWQL